MTEISKGKKMTHPEKVREQAIGPFNHDEAIDCIKKSALVLTNLDLNDRFVVDPWPRPVTETVNGQTRTYYQAVIIDKRPDEPRPDGLTTLDIRVAVFKGYTKARPKPQVSEAEPRGGKTQYEAFGETKNLNQWAKAVGVTWPTLKSRIDAGMTMEEALTQIALKKASR